MHTVHWKMLSGNWANLPIVIIAANLTLSFHHYGHRHLKFWSVVSRACIERELVLYMYRVACIECKATKLPTTCPTCRAFIVAHALRCLKVSACVCGPDRIAPGFGINERVFACLSGFIVFERSVFRTAVFWTNFRTKYGKSILVGSSDCIS